MELTITGILGLGSERAVADMVVEMIGDDTGRFSMVMDLCFLDKYPLSMRAARVIQLCCEKEPRRILPFLPEVIEKTMTAKVDGVKRNFLKILAEFIDINWIADAGPLLNQCFDWITDNRENPAIRIYAMEIACKIGNGEPDLLKELKATIEFLPENSPPSIKNRGAKVLRKIKIS